MSKIFELIEELCPDGVAYKPLGEIAELVRGNGMPKTDFIDSGVGAIHYGQIYTWYGVWTDKVISFVPEEKAVKLVKVNTGDIIITNTSENLEDVCKAVAWLGEDDIVTGGHATVIRHTQNPKYLSYYFQSVEFQRAKKKFAFGAKVIDVSAKNLAKIEIPVPPLEVQEEIVRILDKFTLLEAELEAELEARAKQYAFYQGSLMNFSQSDNLCVNFQWRTLAEVSSKISAGGDVPADCNKGQKGPSDLLPYPVYSNGVAGKDLYGFSAGYKVESKAVTVSARGTIGYHTIREPFFTPIVRLITIVPDERIVSCEFLNYILNITDISSSGGSIPQLTVPVLKEIKIPVPPLDEQRRIVEVLDRFDALVNDISSGLPAEIAARRKQYEYYRDKLLTFKELPQPAPQEQP